MLEQELFILYKLVTFIVYFCRTVCGSFDITSLIVYIAPLNCIYVSMYKLMLIDFIVS